MSTVLATFGTWEVTPDGINSTQEDRYELGIDEIFRTNHEDGYKVWDFPVHLTHKSWLLGENDYRLDEFNEAFKYAQKKFAHQRPEGTEDVSEAYTYQLQRDLRQAMNRR
ncbi:hypothetical protein [Solirubrum puertoriconensis]|uniref:Uncharacterized protein n=1 Tax=Solirubrum puertoriconensis TaxID=1751427 RepID=A0A9X0L496_SOLP1|nr:hypothetical protein [Solirubrum puertoriconensis]KUG07406.1 hypothetical protein ASU33_13720 [Solirubrum puertoriconensis]